MDGPNESNGLAGALAENARLRSLLEASGLHREVTDNLGDAVFYTDAGLQIRYWNAAAERLYGWSAEEAIGRHTAELLDSEIPNSSRAEALAILTQTGRWTGECTHRRRDGHRIYLSSSSTMVRDATGRFVGFVAVNRDISRQKADQARIEDGARRARLLADLSRDLAADAQSLERILEHITRTVSVSIGDAAVLMLLRADGEHLELAAVHDEDEFRAVQIREAVTEDVIRRGESVSGRVVSSGEPIVIPSIDPEAFMPMMKPEHRARAAILPVHGIVCVPLKARGATIGALSAIRFTPGKAYSPEDVHSLTALADHAALAICNATLHRDLSARSSELGLAVAELETFAYSVSHDLQAPLRTIRGFSEILLDDVGGQLDGDARDLLGRVSKAAGRLSALVEALLGLSRLSRQPMVIESVDLTTLALEIGAELAYRYPNRSVELIVAPGLVGRGDPPLLRTLLVNLLENAWKFSGGVGAPRVTLSATAEGAFEVRDNGVGFDQAHAARLFQPFERLHDVEAYPGTGVGLATVHRIVRRHGGEVWADSKPGAGAAFYFTLPG